MGLKVSNPSRFTELFLDIALLAVEELKFLKPFEERIDISKIAEHGLYSKLNSFTSKVEIQGDGYHHRKVSTNDGHTWKKRDVTFRGHINVSGQLAQHHWRSQSTGKAMAATLEKEYLIGREKASEQHAKILYLKNTKLKACVKELLSMLI